MLRVDTDLGPVLDADRLVRRRKLSSTVKGAISCLFLQELPRTSHFECPFLWLQCGVYAEHGGPIAD